MNSINAYRILSEHSNINIDDLKKMINITNLESPVIIENIKQNTTHTNNANNNNSTNNANNIILPFCGKINYECCKAIVYNHGLFTQCTNKSSNEVCKSCSKLKYGKISDRIGVKKNEFITSNGKKEISYETFMKKMNYNIDDVRRELNKLDLKYEFDIKDNNIKKRGRGRPKKNEISSDNDSDVEIEVEKVYINEKYYYKTENGVYLDVDTNEVVNLETS